MKRFKTLFSFITLLLLSSCIQESVLSDGSEAVEIELSGDIGGLSASDVTRGQIDAGYTSAISLNFARLDQNANGTWPSYNTASTATLLPATRAAGSGTAARALNFVVPQYYLTRTSYNSTQLVGFSVVNATGISSGKVTWDISGGTTDVMLSNVVEANMAAKFGASGKIHTFSHLLTHVTVKAFGAAEAATMWGNITSVKVKSQPTECFVTLPATVSWGTTLANLALRNSTNDAAMGAVSLSGKTTSANAAVCGYAMFRPTTGNTLTLEVTTVLGGTRDVPVALAVGSTFAAGTAYTITLEFKATQIMPTATISPWTAATNNPSVDL